VKACQSYVQRHERDRVPELCRYRVPRVARTTLLLVMLSREVRLVVAVAISAPWAYCNATKHRSIQSSETSTEFFRGTRPDFFTRVPSARNVTLCRAKRSNWIYHYGRYPTSKGHVLNIMWCVTQVSLCMSPLTCMQRHCPKARRLRVVTSLSLHTQVVCITAALQPHPALI
jgi:hypothetical protein